MADPETGKKIPLHLCQVLEEEYATLHGPLPVVPSWEITTGQVRDPDGLLARLAAPDDPLAERLRGFCSLDFGRELARWRAADEPPDDRLAAMLVVELNGLLRCRLYDPDAFAEVELPRELRSLLHASRGWPPEDEDLHRLNRLLLEAAFPRELAAGAEGRLAALFGAVHRLAGSGRTALCLSGGGIRSAVFSLGVLQGLARQGLLGAFDYLSTVSGGGYMGGLLASWIHRHPRGLDGVAEELAPREAQAKLKPEAGPLEYLRAYSNYLSPRLGFLSADTWTLIATYLRNLYLHWLILLPLLVAALLLPRLLLSILGLNPRGTWLNMSVLVGSCVLMTLSIAFISLCRPSGLKRRRLPPGVRNWRENSQREYLLWGLGPFLTGALLVIVWWAWRQKAEPGWTPGPIWFYLPPALVILLGWSIHAVPVMLWSRERRRGKLFELWGVAASSLLIGAMLRGVTLRLFPNPGADRWLAYACFALPLLLLGFILSETLLNGVISRWTGDEDHEWWARHTAWVLIAVAVWSGVSVVEVYGPLVLLRWREVLAPLGGLAGIATALLAGSSHSAARPRSAALDLRALATRVCLALAAPAFVVFLLAVISLGVSRILSFLAQVAGPLGADGAACFADAAATATAVPLLSSPPNGSPAIRYWNGHLCVLREAPALVILELLVLTAAMGTAMAFFLNINKFSLHAMYRNRLIRTFLGASRIRRRPHPFTGFDPDDNFEIHRLTVPLFFHRRSVRDAAALCRRLATGVDAAAAALAHRLSPALRRRLATWSGEVDGPPPCDLLESLLAELNRLLRERFDDELLSTLGASSGERRAIHEEEERSGIRALALHRELVARALEREIDGAPPRPLSVVNVALNLVGGNKLAWQQRKAAPFTFTPLACGSLEIGYRRAADYARGEGDEAISLGTALAISGAAASPNMGYHSSPAITFLMTFWNARLGWWLGNPGIAGQKTYRHSHPAFAVGPLLDEALGLTDDANRYVYLSDGGHFENLGLYEMVLRRCRVIVAVDAGCDPEGQCEDLGNAIRKIRIDLGIPIDLCEIPACADPDKPGHEPSKGSYCALGTIRYSCVDDAGVDGTLLYIKPVVHGGEPRDILQYWKLKPEFPHESTGDQWFSESQFESYRMLGFHAVAQICGTQVPLGGLGELIARARVHLAAPGAGEGGEPRSVG